MGIRGLERLRNVKVQYAYVEDQSESLQSNLLRPFQQLLVYMNRNDQKRKI